MKRQYFRWMKKFLNRRAFRTSNLNVSFVRGIGRGGLRMSFVRLSTVIRQGSTDIFPLRTQGGTYE